MNIFFRLFCLALIITLSGYLKLNAQVDLGDNTNCSAIYQVCGIVNTTRIYNSESPDCNNGEMELWFAVDVISNPFHVYFDSNVGIESVSVYGPFGATPDCSGLGTPVLDYNPYTEHSSDFSFYTNRFSPVTPPIGRYIVRILFDSCELDLRIFELLNIGCPPNEGCDEEQECSVFQLDNGKRYWISAWVKEDHSSQVLDYTSYIEMTFDGAGGSPIDFSPSGEIIDGWQRIFGDFTIPSGTTDLKIDLVNDSNVDVYFDDIRVHPWNAGMKSYVYDPETFWLTAELDDNNYATFYEYDKEGGLVRIKKETARGVMTIQETRSHTATE